ncbi:leucyl aminopeptidase family protein [Sphingomonas aestuarii]
MKPIALPLVALAMLVAAPASAQRMVDFAATAPTSGTLVLPLSNAAEIATRAPGLDAAARDAVARALTAQEFDFDKGSTATVAAAGGYRSVVVIGMGNDPLAATDLHELGAVAARETKGATGPVAIAAGGLPEGAAAELGLGARLGGYAFDIYKTKDAKAGAPAPITVIGTGGATWDRRNAALADGVALARDLISEPANVIYPESFVDRTRKALAGTRGVTIEVLDEAQMERMGMGAILSVGKGSARPPRMLVVHYRGSNAQPVVLAGKGITFDTGGISIKPGAGLWRMKGDMAGAAAVIGTVHALAKSGAPVNVVAIAALAENMPSDRATRPGDVVRAYNGRTIEVLNTDAEGRMVLADAVAYAESKFKPAAIVDIATLTGAKVTALGSDHAAVFTRNDALASQLQTASEASNERVWRLPLTQRYVDSVRSDIADYADIADGGGTPGAAYGAAFISRFVTPATAFAHIDIAGMQFGVTGPLTPTGVDAFGVRLLESFVRNFQPVAGE